MTDRQSTHSHDCWSWGHGHYECAVREIEALRAEVAEWKRVASAQAELHGEAEARADKLAAALRDCRKLAYNCHRDELPGAIITTASKAVAEYDALRRLRTKPTTPPHLKEQSSTTPRLKPGA